MKSPNCLPRGELRMRIGYECYKVSTGLNLHFINGTYHYMHAPQLQPLNCMILLRSTRVAAVAFAAVAAAPPAQSLLPVQTLSA